MSTEDIAPVSFLRCIANYAGAKNIAHLKPILGEVKDAFMGYKKDAKLAVSD
jgi:hypothetical protein